jgi:hypothetical protein
MTQVLEQARRDAKVDYPAGRLVDDIDEDRALYICPMRPRRGGAQPL